MSHFTSDAILHLSSFSCHSCESHVQFRGMLRGESRNLYDVDSVSRHGMTTILCIHFIPAKIIVKLARLSSRT